MFEKFIKEINNECSESNFSLSMNNKKDGRIDNQYYFDLLLEKNDTKKKLMNMSIYEGKMPNYKAWIEMFSIKREVVFNDFKFIYFDSDIESKLLDIASKLLGKGSRIFIEYQHDYKTKKELNKSVPEPCSRLGYKLFKRDFTWFKDWYFSEGFHEGNQRLQGEKAIDKKHKKRQLNSIKIKVEKFLKEEKRRRESQEKEDSKKRGEKILETIKRDHSSD